MVSGRQTTLTTRGFSRTALAALLGAVMTAGMAPAAYAQSAPRSGSSQGSNTSTSTSTSGSNAKADAKANAKADARAMLGGGPPGQGAPEAQDDNGNTFVWGGTSSMSVYESDENGKKIHVEVRDGKVTRAEIDGKAVPQDRIEKDGETVRLKDADGNVVFEHKFEGADSSGLQRTLILNGAPSGTWNLRAPKVAAGVPVEPPKVMIGVTMAEPDSSLRGHLGLEEGKATMITAVYDGLPAAKAGIDPYDIIVAVNGKEPAGQEDVRKVLKSLNAGDKVVLGVIHRGVKHDVTIAVEAFDAEKFKSAKVRAITASNGQDRLAPIAVGSVDGGNGDYARFFHSLMGRTDGSMQWFTPDQQEEMTRKLQAEAAMARDKVQAEVEKLHDRLGSVDFEQQMTQMREQMKKMQEMIEEMWKSRSAEPKQDAEPNKNKS